MTPSNPAQSWFGGPFAVVASTLGAAVSITAANIAYLYGTPLNPSDGIPAIVLAAKPLIWLATLNKPVLPLLGAFLTNSFADEVVRGVATVAALLGIGAGTSAGAYLLVWIYGCAVTRSGIAFGWGALGVFKLVCLSISAAYFAFGLWYLINARQALVIGPLVIFMGVAVGCFIVALFEFGLLAVSGYICYPAVKELFRNRNQKKW
jgi:hypothetical protein